MNEWPLIQWWTWYHGDMFGFENLYIIDSSTDERCVNFLSEIRDKMGVNVIFTEKNLNDIVGIINVVMRKLVKSSDMMIKMDTDEFLSVLPDPDSCDSSRNETRDTKCLLTPYGVKEYLQTSEFLLDGNMLKVGYTSLSKPNKKLCDQKGEMFYGDIWFDIPQKYTRKVIFDSRTFFRTDLGSHQGTALVPFSGNYTNYKTTRLGIIHLRSTCLEIEMENSRKACLSHGFIAASDKKDDEITKLLKFNTSVGHPCETLMNTNTQLPSHHKIHGYLRYLLCPDKVKKEYYASNGGRPSVNPLFKAYMNHIYTLYKS